MRQKYLILIFFSLIFKTVYTQHFISDPKIRMSIQQKLEKRKLQFSTVNFDFLSIFPEKINLREFEAMQFLYAYMSLNDLIDKTPHFYLQQVQIAFEAQKTFNWGKSVPEDLFRHFVMPPRVNNEDLDTARVLFFNELKPRIINLTMYEAALEVNHWCHEKMAYRGADERTSSPLASLLTALGRCGEESTFAVTAFRAVGIPARQCYTPRWAHTDDNHAWVEVWVDGKWQYLGACEPEPELNMGWFAQPAKRAMMVHTNVFGPYRGKEEILLYDQNFTKINLIQNYATTKTISVRVLDAKGIPVPQSIVKFQLYNYAEFYTIAEQKTTENGISKITTGLGDLMVWAIAGNKFGYKKISVSETDTVVIIPNQMLPISDIQQFEIIPPVSKQILATSSVKSKANSIRLQYEDSVRTEYTKTFMSRQKMDEFFRDILISKDSAWMFIQKSEGNWREISQFIHDNANNSLLFNFLSGIADKDLRDVKSKTLTSHLQNVNTANFVNSQIPFKILEEGVLSSRISNELITQWRSFLTNKFTQEEKAKFRNSPIFVKDYLYKNIQILEENHSRCPISPEGVIKLKHADIHSLNICFVAICRSVGIPSRINAATKIPQYYENKGWIDVFFSQLNSEKQNYATLLLENDTHNIIKPVYYTHFTIARLQNSEFVTLDYENNPQLQTFPATVSLQTGFYRLITGNRQNDGSVLVRTEVFEIKTNDTLRKTILLRNVFESKKEKPKVNFKTLVSTLDNQFLNLNDQCAKKGLVLLFIDPAKEPTRHVLNDLKMLKEDFNYWGGKIVFVVPQNLLTSGYLADTTSLPQNSSFVIDYNNVLLNSMKSTVQIQEDFPISMLINAKMELLFYTTGYRIGIGETILQNIQSDSNQCKK